jgi:hypothetical protein
MKKALILLLFVSLNTFAVNEKSPLWNDIQKGTFTTYKRTAAFAKYVVALSSFTIATYTAIGTVFGIGEAMYHFSCRCLSEDFTRGSELDSLKFSLACAAVATVSINLAIVAVNSAVEDVDALIKENKNSINYYPHKALLIWQ